MKNRILVAMFASAFFAANAAAGYLSIQLLMDAGPTAGNVTFLFLGTMLGSVWPDLFSKSIERTNSAGLLCLASYCLFFLSAIVSCWQIYMA